MIYTICTSEKFKDIVPKVAEGLERKGHIVFIPIFYKDSMENHFTIHFKKIIMSDGIYVLDVNGYVGESVSAEIACARLNNKRVDWFSGDIDIQKFVNTYKEDE